MMEALDISKKSVNSYQTLRRYIPEESYLNVFSYPQVDTLYQLK
jgi:hypothetical protein